MAPSEEYHLSNFLNGKSGHTLALFDHFINSFNTIGKVEVVPLKSMIGLDNGHKRIAYITQLGKNFIHVVFPFKQEYPDNLCFQKIAQVPGQQQFNHHFRMLNLEDVNDEVLGFMQLAYREEA
ncbi:DUF5655 domain-containing protein [Mucilaginibacter aquariorum]|uniref:DUF5655 domain-containing protein n=1 Tax=Mucilaginibacter aquariorum TaxID=2967225 RepID=A0ABT1SZA9_9SPHI|nr:DUF5655 domain-containing protein [Mucilaginibacter aquariorum]MCQ6957553.1 DUF5655 domain-containing protein [Mucilaginibacter aquariorum]